MRAFDGFNMGSQRKYLIICFKRVGGVNEEKRNNIGIDDSVSLFRVVVFHLRRLTSNDLFVYICAAVVFFFYY